MATVPALSTQSAGGTATAAYANSIRDAITFFTTGRPRALLRQTVAQSLTSAASPPITFDVEDLDNDGGHSTVTNTSRYTAQTAGWWRVSGLLCVLNGTGQRSVKLSVNGTLLNASQTQINAAVTGSTNTPLASRLVFLAVGDYVELLGFQNSGGALNTSVLTAEQSTMSLTWEGS